MIAQLVFVAYFRSCRVLRCSDRTGGCTSLGEPRFFPAMTVQKGRATYALPVVVPPVSHKFSVLPDTLKPLWRLAEDRLRAADDVVVFGYSCPALDHESANLLARTNRNPTDSRTISIIDPEPSVATRYIRLPSKRERPAYYSSGHVDSHRATLRRGGGSSVGTPSSLASATTTLGTMCPLVMTHLEGAVIVTIQAQ